MLSNLILSLLMFFAFVFNINIQPDEEPPYLYYYSRMLGGIIIERADGTDSRHLGANVIPEGMTGIAGPGWSPSGRYFAVSGTNYLDYVTSQGVYLFDTQNNSTIELLSFAGGIYETYELVWSPADDWLLIIGTVGSIGRDPGNGRNLYYWLINTETKQIAAEFGVYANSASNVVWEIDQARIRFYTRFYLVSQGKATSDQYFEIIIMLDGRVLKEAATREVFYKHYTPPSVEQRNNITDQAISPSGNYEAEGLYPTILTNVRTHEQVVLPDHTQGTSCRTFVWSDNEQYIITLNGTLFAGGGCGYAVLGVTNFEGKLWRELGGCSWDFPPCIGWLPKQVNLNMLPSGSSMSVQLDPIRIDYEDQQVNFVGGLDLPYLGVRCSDQAVYIADGNENLYKLRFFSCPLKRFFISNEDNVPVVAAYNSEYELLATYSDFGEVGVTIWTKQSDGSFEPKFHLNSQGFALEFTNDDEYLRARNINGWKVYSVADVLTAIAGSAQP